MVDASVIRERFAAVGRGLDERSRRLLVAAEAKTAGYGGIAAASRATGVARSTIGRGLKDLADPRSLSGKVRRPGSGCPPLAVKDPTLLENLRLLVEPATMGDPMRPLLWVSKSHEKLAAALRELGHKMGSLTQRYVKRHGSDQKGAEARRLCGKEGNFEHLAALGFLLLAATLVIVGLASALLGRDFMLRRERQ